MQGFSVITIGAGIGYALVVHGEVVHSREAGLGLGGHIPLAANGPVCHAGHRGCAEAMLTSGSIAAQVSAALQRDVGYAEVLALAQAGDPAARTVTDAAADALGRFIALAANLTLQHAVVLAGEGIELFVVAEDRVRAAMLADRDPLADPIEVQVDLSGFAAWARGAAAVAVQDAIARLDIASRVPSSR
jgi:predicted NBD/HSP70 family sugar kinase